MALVVAARSPLLGEAQPQRAVAPGLAWLATAGCFAFGIALVADAAAHVGLDPGAQPIRVAATVIVALLCVTAWITARHEPGVLLAATLAAVLVALRAVAAGLLYTLELPLLAALADGALGFVVLGSLVWTAVAALDRSAYRVPRTAYLAPETAFFRRVVYATVLLTFLVTVSGFTVRAAGADWACRGAFPGCNGLGLLPFGRDPLSDIQLYHRMLAYVGVTLVAWLTIEARRRRPAGGGAALALLGCMLAEAVFGGISVSVGNPPFMQILHAAGATAAWSAAVVLAGVARRPATSVAGHAERGTRNAQTTAFAYIQLTKPRVMSLLLATTAAAMVIAARGLPDVGVLIATLLGGALMSGGAAAINHYVDRDIDSLMGRTAWRPIPSGVIAPRRALWFGIGLAVVASAVFVIFVNVIACVLALLGLLGYVFIYTLWLKRSTPSNIVIGGAAGAIPPLVGWAAVTNEISSLTAWYLFAIIFFWTPPHFWALSLLIRQHYERAGLPMLPVVRGEGETRRQIVLYSVLLVVLTLVLSPFGMMGGVYFVAAAVLGALFVWGAVRLWQTGTRPAARSLYLYSIGYLFALFGAMAIDRIMS